jgi:DNA-binding NtrC family response regulator
MRDTLRRLELIAPREVTVLLEGESGTGKELAADAIHASSPRARGPFVVVDCGAIPRTLIEAELFGHERGAYTGATQAREGAFLSAEGGTVFLDEVGELDLDVQPRLLRVLERREIKAIGGASSRRIDVRIIAATNRDLQKDVARGAFRADLYYRLAVTRVRMPALRERPEDIPLLCRHFLAELSERDGIEYAFGDQQIERLAKRPWAGNVRELKNWVERLATFGAEEAETPAPVRLGPALAAHFEKKPFHEAKARVVATFERDYLVSILAEHGGNITAAASAAGVDRVHFLRLLDRHGLRKRA